MKKMTSEPTLWNVFGKQNVNSTEIKEFHKSQESTNTRRTASLEVKVFDDLRESTNANSDLEIYFLIYYRGYHKM